MRRTLLGSLSAALVALVLVGCAPQDEPEPTPSASPTASAAPTEEEILAEARETYEGFLQSIADMRAAGENDYTMLLEYATDLEATATTASVQDVVDQGYVIRGAPVVTNLTVVDEAAERNAPLTVGVCTDASGVTVTDGAGNDINSSNRQVINSFRSALVWSDAHGRYRVDASEPWGEGAGDPCG